MKNNTNAIRFAGAAVLAAGMLMAQATAPPATAGVPAWLQNKIDRAAIVLDFTPQQKTQVQNIASAAMAQAQPIVQQLKANRASMRQLITSAAPATQIQSLAAQQGTLIGQLIGIRSTAMAQVWSLLTPAQQQKALQLHEFGYGGRGGPHRRMGR
jgi:Spy/CpxP family protein refolding chaperone